jgi:hypothetical protein
MELSSFALVRMPSFQASFFLLSHHLADAAFGIETAALGMGPTTMRPKGLGSIRQ